LDSKADSSHSHAIAATSGLQAALDSKVGTAATAYDSARLSGVGASSYARTDTTETFSGKVNFTNDVTFDAVGSSFTFDADGAGRVLLSVTANGNRIWNVRTQANDDLNFERASGSGELKVNNNSIWHAGNFNPSSKLGTGAKAADSDKLNGLAAGDFIRTTGWSTVYGNTEWQDNKAVRFGDGSDMRIFHDSTYFYNRIDLYYGNLSIREDGTNTRFTFDRVTGDFMAVGAITANSDERIKDDFKVIDGALDRVDQLTGYTYERTDIETDRKTGLIAQEVLKVLPEAVKYNADTDRYSLAYGNMMGLMVEAIKELKQEVEALKQKQGE
jgi:hypothetical protein